MEQMTAVSFFASTIEVITVLSFYFELITFIDSASYTGGDQGT